MKDSKEEIKKYSRYPYTYAYDFLRMTIPYGENGCKLSRSDCAHMCEKICSVFGMSKEDFVEKLADYYIDNKEEIDLVSTDDAMRFYKARFSR